MGALCPGSCSSSRPLSAGSVHSHRRQAVRGVSRHLQRSLKQAKKPEGVGREDGHVRWDRQVCVDVLRAACCGLRGTVWKRMGMDEGSGRDLQSCVCVRRDGRGLLPDSVAAASSPPSRALPVGWRQWGRWEGRGTGTYREDVGTPLGLLADGCGGGGGRDGLDAQLPLADAGGGGD